MQLAHLWDEDESFARDVEAMSKLDFAGQEQHELVSRPELVRAVDGAGDVRIELRCPAGEQVEPEDGATAVWMRDGSPIG